MATGPSSSLNEDAEWKKLCENLHNPKEHWTKKLEAVHAAEQFLKTRNPDPEGAHGLLKEIKGNLIALLGDLRGSIVKATCTVVELFITILKNKFSDFSGEFIPPLLKLHLCAISSMSKSGQSCIEVMMKDTYNCIPPQCSKDFINFLEETILFSDQTMVLFSLQYIQILSKRHSISFPSEKLLELLANIKNDDGAIGEKKVSLILQFSDGKLNATATLENNSTNEKLEINTKKEETNDSPNQNSPLPSLFSSISPSVSPANTPVTSGTPNGGQFPTNAETKTTQVQPQLQLSQSLSQYTGNTASAIEQSHRLSVNIADPEFSKTMFGATQDTPINKNYFKMQENLKQKDEQIQSLKAEIEELRQINAKKSTELIYALENKNQVQEQNKEITEKLKQFEENSQNSLSQTKKEWKSKLKDKEREIAQILKTKEAENLKNTQDLEEAHNRIDQQKDEEINSLKKQISESQFTIMRLTEELEAQKEKFSAYKSQYQQDLESAKETAAKEASILTNEIEEMENQLNEEIRNKKNVEQKLAQYESMISEFELLTKREKKDKNSNEQEATKLLVAYTNSEKNIKDLQKKYEQEKTNSELMKKKLEESKSKETIANKSIETWETKYKALHEKANLKFDQANERIRKLKLQLKNTQTETTEAISNLNKKVENYEKMEKEYKKIKTSANMHQEELNILKEEVAANSKKVTSLKAKKEELVKKLLQTEKALEENTINYSESQKEKIELIKKTTEIEQSLREIFAENQSLKATLYDKEKEVSQFARKERILIRMVELLNKQYTDNSRSLPNSHNILNSKSIDLDKDDDDTLLRMSSSEIVIGELNKKKLNEEQGQNNENSANSIPNNSENNNSMPNLKKNFTEIELEELINECGRLLTENVQIKEELREKIKENEELCIICDELLKKLEKRNQ